MRKMGGYVKLASTFICFQNSACKFVQDASLPAKVWSKSRTATHLHVSFLKQFLHVGIGACEAGVLLIH